MKEQVNRINGINIYSLTNQNLKSFCLSLYIRAGSLFEDISQNGISHLFEHVVFRNLKRKYPDFYELLAIHGIELQGQTYKEFIRFTVTAPASEFEFATDIFCSLFDEIELSTVDFSNEKKRIKAEIREADERNTLDFLFNKTVWQNTEAEKTVLGYCKVIDRVSIKRLNEFRKKILSKDNIFVYATGNLSYYDIDLLRGKLSNVEVTDSSVRFENKISLNDGFFNRDGSVIVKNDSTWHYIEIGFDIASQKYSGGVYDVLYALLFKGDVALVNNYLSEDNPFMYSFGSTFEQYDNIGNMNFKFEVEKDMLMPAINTIIEMLDAVKSGDFNFEANLKAELWNMELEYDNPDDLNWSMAYNNHILKTEVIDYSRRKFGRLENITKEQVIEAAKDIFRLSNMTVAVRGNKKKIKTDELEKALVRLGAV
ncbi:MAG: insulinase family protein [Clostridia bacterium]|nr:insulinase family protein [Clostridia bacterium]